MKFTGKPYHKPQTEIRTFLNENKVLIKFHSGYANFFKLSHNAASIK